MLLNSCLRNKEPIREKWVAVPQGLIMGDGTEYVVIVSN